VVALRYRLTPISHRNSLDRPFWEAAADRGELEKINVVKKRINARWYGVRSDPRELLWYIRVKT